MNNNCGGVFETALLTGERVAVSTRRVLSRKGRCVVRVRVVGNGSLGWLDAAQLWGASVEVFVGHGGNIKHLVESLYPDVYVAPVVDARALLPHRSWDGIMVGTIKDGEDAMVFMDLVKTWLPALVIVASHGSTSRSEFHKWTNLGLEGYEYKSQHKCSHQDFGGVTPSRWRVSFSWRQAFKEIDFSISRMTAGLYPRHLQTALDDTLGAETRVRQLDVDNAPSMNNRKGIIGPINDREPVMNGNGLAVDLNQVNKRNLHRL